MNTNLSAAKRNKNDEFYTQLLDIENELRHYKGHFEGKVVYLNCDDPQESNFWMYFMLNFEFLGLRKLISTHYDDIGPTYKLEYLGREVNPDGPVRTELEENGDFRSNESIELLKESDIVVTNPPFSLFREYIAQIMEYEKQFLVVGNNNAITYKEIFPRIKDGEMWLGYHTNKTMEFRLSPSYERWDRMDDDGHKYGKVPAISWFTNLDHSKRHDEQILYREYSEEAYPHYDNYDAINVDKVKDIPMNYEGIMGVPITFMSNFNPDQFEIVGIACGNSWANYKETLEALNFNPNIRYGGGLGTGIVNGQAKYARLLIRKR